MAEIFRGLLAIASTSIEVGWPLFILPVGLGGIAYFGGKIESGRWEDDPWP